MDTQPIQRRLTDSWKSLSVLSLFSSLGQLVNARDTALRLFYHSDHFALVLENVAQSFVNLTMPWDLAKHLWPKL